MIRKQSDALDRLDLLERRVIRKMAPKYKQGVQAPIVKAIDGAKSIEGLLAALGPSVARKMDAGVVADALADTITQVSYLGAVAETRPVLKEKSDNAKT
jgi:hypothetical protein